MRRLRYVRVLAAVFVLALVAGLAAACDDDDDNGNGDGNGGGETITIGIANEAPYGFEEDGDATGEAPALAREILSRMGYDNVDFVVADFGALIAGLNADRFDVIAAGMFITPERAEEVLFTDPDYCAFQSFGVPEGNPDAITDFASVADAGVTLGILTGAVEEDYALDAGVDAGQIDAYETVPDLFDALEAGRIEALGLTSVTVEYNLQDVSGYESTEPFIPTIDGEEQQGCGAFAFRSDDQDLRDEFNDILNEMKENDEILPIVEEFGFTAAEIDAAKGVTVEDLAG